MTTDGIEDKLTADHASKPALETGVVEQRPKAGSLVLLQVVELEVPKTETRVNIVHEFLGHLEGYPLFVIKTDPSKKILLQLLHLGQ